MREENYQKNSRKRLNALILLVAFTAILLIVSTYAWFSTQRNVTISGLTGIVNVAEGLQISLDALNWANEIDLSDNGVKYFAQTNKDLGYTDGEMLSLTNPWKAGTGYSARTNLVPEELIPASTSGQGNDAIGLADMLFYRGEIDSGATLKNIAQIQTGASAGNPGYYAIDLFLQNSSASTVSTDVLQLESNSTITLGEGKTSTGLQNTLRVAFAIFDDNGSEGASVNATPTQAEILAATASDDRKIKSVAIWEPNAYGAQVSREDTITTYAAHVNYIVQNNNRLTLSTTDMGTAGLSGTSRFAADTKLPTYALSNGTPETVTDLYSWDTDAATNGLLKQNALQTSNEGLTEATTLLSAADGTTQITIPASKYVHMRMYVWLEGQDVDCINYASLGGNVTLDIGLSKPQIDQGD